MKYIYIISLLFLASCSKNIQQETKRISGLLPDNPKEVAKVPLMQSKSNVKFASRGKPPKGDRANPSVTIYSPVAGSVTGIVNVTGFATDNTAVVRVSLFVNGILHSSNAIVNFSWDTRLLANDAYQLTVVAYDASGNSSSASVTVTKNVIIVTPPDTTIGGRHMMATPPVRDQFSEGSCVGFSVGYAARSIEWYYKTGATDFNDAVNIFSPEYLYNQVKFTSDCNSGTAMQTALDFVKVNGICTFQSMPYSGSNGCSWLPNAAQQTEAALYKCDYVKMYTTDSAAIKAMLRTNHAIVISLITDNAFINAKEDFIWKSSSEYTIAHSVIICGYDDSRNAYRIMNSFGTSWGGAGFLWIDYDFFLTRTGTYCYVIN